jgi:hypothetical protein
MVGSFAARTFVTGARGRSGTRPAEALARRSAALPTRALSGTPNPNDVARRSAAGGSGALCTGELDASNFDPLSASGVRD